MLTRRVRLQLLAFVVIAALGITYVGVQYVGLDRLVRDRGYTVSLELPATGGLFANAEVTYRGAPVGRVRSVDLSEDGVVAVLAIDQDAPRIPADAEAVVANRSAIGEQYLDLRPDDDNGPYLQQGSTLEAGEDSLPPRVDVLLRDTRDFAASVPQDDLRTVVDELYDATRGSADPLRQLLGTSTDLLETADRSLPATQSLIESSSTVLATQEESAASIRSFSRDLRVLSRSVAASDRDLRALLAAAPVAAQQIDDLFVDVGQPLGIVMSNLISTAQIVSTNSRGVREVMIGLPQAIDAGYAVTGSTGLRIDLVPNFFAPLPCVVGYEATPLRSGLDTSPGSDLSTSVGCTAPAESGINVRGGQNAPAPDRPASAADGLQVTSPTELSDLMGG